MSKPPKPRGNPDFRRFATPPAPPIPELEQSLRDLIQPATLLPLKTVTGQSYRLRDRVLTFTVLCAVVLSLILRQAHYLSEMVRLLAFEGVLWVKPQKVSKQALSQRLQQVPAALFLEVLNQALAQLRARPHAGLDSRGPGVHSRFAAVWLADGSTLSRLQRHLGQLREQAPRLAGKLLMVVEACTWRPVMAGYDADGQQADAHWRPALLAQLPVGGLLVFDLGFFHFGWFDQFTPAGKFFLSRYKRKTSYAVKRCLAEGPRYRDEIIQLGCHQPRCREPLRLVSVLWAGTWRAYLTNVLDPQQLSAQEICALYHCRWRIETAFCLTKRVLGLAYLWVGGSNGVQIQLYATWLLYAVLNELCAEVALALGQPLERISMTMLFRSFYHFAQQRQQQPDLALVPFLVKHHRLLGLLKATRKRQRRKAAIALDIWHPALT